MRLVTLFIMLVSQSHAPRSEQMLSRFGVRGSGSLGPERTGVPGLGFRLSH